VLLALEAVVELPVWLRTAVEVPEADEEALLWAWMRGAAARRTRTREVVEKYIFGQIDTR